MEMDNRITMKLATMIKHIITFLIMISPVLVCAGDGIPAPPAIPVPNSLILTNRELEKLPPSPPSADFVMKVVFSRFPGVSSDEVTKFMNEYFVQEVREVKQMAEVLPDKAVERLTDIVQECISLMRIRNRDAELFSKIMEEKRLNKVAQRRAEAIREAKGTERNKGIEELRKILETTFEIKQELMKRDVEGLEKELEQLKQLVKLREQRKNEIINGRLTELVNGRAEIRW